MKKNLLMMLAVLAMVFVSCSNEQGTDVGDKKPANLTIKLAGITSSRAIQEPGKTIPNSIVLSDGYIFILNPTGGVEYGEELDVTAAAGGTGQRLAEDVPSDSRVYIVGNYVGAGITLATLEALQTLTNIQATVAATTAQQTVGYAGVALANVGGTPVQISLNGNTPDDDNQATVEATVTVTINPLISRIELGKVTGGTKITAFTVAGVYVDSWYSTFNLGGSFGAGSTLLAQNQSIDFSGNALKDEGTWAAVSGTPGTVPFVATPQTANDGKVWAYNVPADGLPRLIIKLTGVKYMADTDSNPATPEVEVTDPATLYITVTGYTDPAKGNAAITTFLRGNIYNIGGDADGHGNGIVFNPEQTGLTPNPVGVTLAVTVGIKEWDIVYPDPIL